MEKTTKVLNVPTKLSNQALLELHRHYESVVKDMLDLWYQYLNFYTGLLVAILAATLTGSLSLKHGDIRIIGLLLGPLLTIILAAIGYANIRVFYSRYVQAWVTTINIESMLGIRYASSLDQGKYCPVYRSKMGGFIPMIERTSIESALNTAKNEQWTAEKVVTVLLRVGDTRKNAKNTFLSFGLVSILLAGGIIFVAFYH